MRKQQGRPTAVIKYIVLTLVVVVLGIGLVTTRQANAHHPEPRADISGESVAPASAFADLPRVAQVYEKAAQIPEVLDGLYCHCDCSKHSSHRSLLTCFQSEHGAGCDVCLTEAALAYDMTRQGRSLKDIREAVDALYP